MFRSSAFCHPHRSKITASYPRHSANLEGAHFQFPCTGRHGNRGNLPIFQALEFSSFFPSKNAERQCTLNICVHMYKYIYTLHYIYVCQIRTQDCQLINYCFNKKTSPRISEAEFSHQFSTSMRSSPRANNR